MFWDGFGWIQNKKNIYHESLYMLYNCDANFLQSSLNGTRKIEPTHVLPCPFGIIWSGIPGEP